MKTKKRYLSILLTLALVLGQVPEMSRTAYASMPDKVYYRVYDYSDSKLTYTDNEIAGTDITEVTSSTTAWSNGTYVVYTERVRVEENGQETEVTRLISARFATNFERGLYYGKYD